jgi:hypothetical protein
MNGELIFPTKLFDFGGTASKPNGSLMTGSASTTPSALTPHSTSARRTRHTLVKWKYESGMNTRSMHLSQAAKLS